MAGVFHVDGIMFEEVGKSLGVDGDGTAHELGNVVALHREAMGIGTGHREFERTGGTTLFIDVSDERTGEGAIVAATAEDDPTAIARPRVIALGVGRIKLDQVSQFTIGQFTIYD